MTIEMKEAKKVLGSLSIDEELLAFELGLIE